MQSLLCWLPCLQFNARSETVAEKPAFRRLLPTRRCLVLLDGFYEWQKVCSKQWWEHVLFYVDFRGCA